MKNIILSLCLLTALVCSPVACKSPERTAYQLSGAVINTEDAAMKAWADYVVSGRATPAQEATARALHEKYLAAVRTEQAVILSYKQNPDKPALDNAVAAVSAASANLIDFVRKLVGK